MGDEGDENIATIFDTPPKSSGDNILIRREITRDLPRLEKVMLVGTTLSNGKASTGDLHIASRLRTSERGITDNIHVTTSYC